MGISVLKEVLFPAGVVAHTVILALGGERQKDPKFKASLGSKTQNKRILLITNCFRDRTEITLGGRDGSHIFLKEAGKGHAVSCELSGSQVPGRDAGYPVGTDRPISGPVPSRRVLWAPRATPCLCHRITHLLPFPLSYLFILL